MNPFCPVFGHSARSTIMATRCSPAGGGFSRRCSRRGRIVSPSQTHRSAAGAPGVMPAATKRRELGGLFFVSNYFGFRDFHFICSADFWRTRWRFRLFVRPISRTFATTASISITDAHRKSYKQIAAVATRFTIQYRSLRAARCWLVNIRQQTHFLPVTTHNNQASAVYGMAMN